MKIPHNIDFQATRDRLESEYLNKAQEGKRMRKNPD